MTTAWIWALCQRMRQIQITQWSGARACNYLRKSSLDAGCFAEENGIVCCRSAADRVGATRAHVSQAVSASCHCNQNFCPPSGSDTRLQIRRVPRSAATWVDVIGWHFPKDNLKFIFWWKMFFVKIPLKSVLKGQINNKPLFGQIVAWAKIPLTSYLPWPSSA